MSAPMQQFIDLNKMCCLLSTKGKENRLDNLAMAMPSAAIYAVGGFPIHYDNGHSWLGHSTDKIPSFVKEGLGVSAVLTYLNPNEKSLEELGDLCVNKGHVWAYHWMMVSIVLARFPLAVELAFAHDTRFKMSWVVQENPTGKVVGITGSIKSWLDYTAHGDDLSFDKDTRQAMYECRRLIQMNILPR